MVNHSLLKINIIIGRALNLWRTIFVVLIVLSALLVCQDSTALDKLTDDVTQASRKVTPQSKLPQIKLILSNEDFTLEMASTDTQIRKGLMARLSMGDKEGMIFFSMMKEQGLLV